jgi:hypothetical protein
VGVGCGLISRWASVKRRTPDVDEADDGRPTAIDDGTLSSFLGSRDYLAVCGLLAGFKCSDGSFCLAQLRSSLYC